MTLLSVFSEGLWIVPLLPFIGSVIFFYRAWKAGHSGSWRYNSKGEREESDENVPFYKTGQFVFSVVLFLATIVIIIMINADK